jgi:hypothetical protein
LPAGRIACIPPGAQSPQRRGWQTLHAAGRDGGQGAARQQAMQGLSTEERALVRGSWSGRLGAGPFGVALPN